MIKFVDTVGFNAGSNIRDLLCAECRASFVPKKRLRSRPIRLNTGQAFVFGDIVAVSLVAAAASAGPAAIRLYMPAGLAAKRTTEQKLRERLNQVGGFNPRLCPVCQERLAQSGWEELMVELTAADELALHGLGWFSCAQHPVTVRLFLPAGAGASVRPRLVD